MMKGLVVRPTAFFVSLSLRILFSAVFAAWSLSHLIAKASHTGTSGKLVSAKGDWSYLNIHCNGQIQYNRSISTELIQHRQGLLDNLLPKRRRKTKTRKIRSIDQQHLVNDDPKSEEKISFASRLFDEDFDKKSKESPFKGTQQIETPAEPKKALDWSKSNPYQNSSLVIREESIGGSTHIHLNANCPETFLARNAINASVTHLIVSSDGKVSVGSDPMQIGGELTYLKIESEDITIPPSCSWLPFSVVTLDLSHSSLHHGNFVDCGTSLKMFSVAGCSLRSLNICLPSLNSVDASWNNLKEIVQECPSGADSVLELNLSQNKIKSWSFCGWPKVTHVNLADNQITNLDLESCTPRAILELKAGGNRLTKMLTYIPPSLTNLDLSHNRIRKMHQWVEETSNLQTLLLSHNELTNLGKRPFRYAYQLFTLDLSYNKFTTLYEFYFTGLRELRSLDVSHNHLQEIKHEAFRPLRNLKKLSLVGNKLTQLDQRLMDSLPRNLDFYAHENPWKCSCHILSFLSQATRLHCRHPCRKPKLECQEGQFTIDIEDVLKQCLQAMGDIERDTKMSHVKYTESDEDLSEEIRDQQRNIPLLVLPGVILIIVVPIMVVVARQLYVKRKKFREKWCNCLSPESSRTTASHNSLSSPPYHIQATKKDSDSETEL